MNVDELRRGLDLLADEVDDPTVRDNGRQAAVDRRIARLRRLRSSVLVGAAVVVVAAGVAVSTLLDGGAAPPTTIHRNVVPVPPGLTVLTDRGVEFYENAGGAGLIAERVSDPLSRTLRLDVAVPTLRLAYVAECWTPGGRSTAHFTTFINGHPQVTGRCNQEPATQPLQPDLAVGGPSPTGVAAAWAETAGLSVVETLHVRMVLTPGASTEARPQLVFGLFTLPDMSQVDGIWYPLIRVIEGVQYSATYGQARQFHGAPSTLRVQIPTDQGQALLEAGVTDLTKPGYFTVGQTATHFAASPRSAASTTTPTSPRDGFVPVTFHGPGTASGTLWSVLYRPLS